MPFLAMVVVPNIFYRCTFLGPEVEEDVVSRVFAYYFGDQYDEVLEGEKTQIEDGAIFDPDIFFYMLLPPIIFHEGKQTALFYVNSFLSYVILNSYIIS